MAGFRLALFCLAIIVCVKPLGLYMARLFEGERTFLSPVLGPIERGIYRLCGVKGRGAALDDLHHRHAGLQRGGVRLALPDAAAAGGVAVQPAGAWPVTSPDLSFNTAISFITNTNWQSYSGETTFGYLVQMLGLTVHNFVSAATGIALALALIRGFARRSAKTVGNFWVDLTRCTLLCPAAASRS